MSPPVEVEASVGNDRALVDRVASAGRQMEIAAYVRYRVGRTSFATLQFG